MGRSSLYVTRLKRVVDITMALVILVILSPLMLAIAVATRLTSKGPILYSQERVGLHNRQFSVVKDRKSVV